MTLYELNDQLARLIEDTENGIFIDTETGEIFNAEALSQLQLDKETKTENLLCLIKNFKAERDAVEAERKKLQAREKSLENRINNITEYAKLILDGEKFKSARAMASFRKTSAVDIAEGTQLPDKYLRFKEPEPNKVLLMQDLKAGKEIDGVQLIERTSLIIK